MIQKKIWIKEQKELGEKMEQAENFGVALNERVTEELENELSFRTRHNRLSIKHKFNPECDLTVQEDASRFSMANIYQKLVNGEPVMPNVIKQGEYLENGIPDGDLTDLNVKHQENIEQYGNISEVEKTTTINDEDIKTSTTTKATTSNEVGESPTTKTKV
jgi:hypothetical protein